MRKTEPTTACDRFNFSIPDKTKASVPLSGADAFFCRHTRLHNVTAGIKNIKQEEYHAFCKKQRCPRNHQPRQPAESGLCTLCRADCKGKCETWLSSLVGRKLLYPRDFGTVTAGANNTTHVGVSYNSLRIQGYAYGAHGLARD